MSSPKYFLGQRVYHVLNGDDGTGLVVGHILRPGYLKYLVIWKDRAEQECHEIELSETPIRDFAD